MIPVPPMKRTRMAGRLPASRHLTHLRRNAIVKRPCQSPVVPGAFSPRDRCATATTARSRPSTRSSYGTAGRSCTSATTKPPRPLLARPCKRTCTPSDSRATTAGTWSSSAKSSNGFAHGAQETSPSSAEAEAPSPRATKRPCVERAFVGFFSPARLSPK
jgi:hypothetical protein